MVWIIMRRWGVSSERRRSSCSSLNWYVDNSGASKLILDMSLNIPGAGAATVWDNFHHTSTTKFPISKNFNVSRLVLQLSSSKPLKLSVKLKMKMYLLMMLQLHLGYQQFDCLLRCNLYKRFDSWSIPSWLCSLCHQDISSYGSDYVLLKGIFFQVVEFQLPAPQ